MRKFLLAIASLLVATSAITMPAAAYPGGQPTYGRPAARFDSKVEVQWGSSWWPATIISASNGQYLIRYDGWSSSWDEWVGQDRIRNPAGVVDRYGDPEIVSIYWGSQWYPGRVMKRQGDSFLVHYDGWSTSFDEWVGNDRLNFIDTAPVYTPRPQPRPTYQPTYQPAPQAPPERPSHVRPGRKDWPTRGPDYR